MMGSIVSRYRKKILRTAKYLTKSRHLVLMYHRIAHLEIDPWGLAVTPENFSEHLSIIKKHAQPISLTDFYKYRKAGQLPERSVVITFDDGYTDNLYNAKPIIDRHQVPASVFVATGYCERYREFWWDELENVLFQTRSLPEKLTLKLDGKKHIWGLGKAISYTDQDKKKDRSMRAWDAQPDTRMQLYHSIWSKLINLPALEIERALDEIIKWANFDPEPRSLYRPMEPDELIDLESSGWIEVGAHTVNHVALARHPIKIQELEISQSKKYLENILGHSIQTFTYPFGNYDRDTISIVKKAGFDCACTTVEETVWKGSDRYLLPRFGVWDMKGKEFENQLLSWLKSF